MLWYAYWFIAFVRFVHLAKDNDSTFALAVGLLWPLELGEIIFSMVKDLIVLPVLDWMSKRSAKDGD